MIYYIADPFQLLEGRELQQQLNYRLSSGGIVTAELMPNNEAKIISIFSTDPMDYMDAKLAPGEVLKLKYE